MSTLKVLVGTFAITLAAAVTFPQQNTSRKPAARPGMVRTVRIEKRQLPAVTNQLAEVVVSTTILDDKGRLLESADYLPGGNPDTKTTSVYDKNGNEIEHASYIHDDLSYRSTTLFDSRNRKIESQSFEQNGQPRSKFIYRYDRRGRKIALELQTGGAMVRRSVTTFDRRGKELELVEYSRTGTQEGRYVYRYDNAGNQISESHYYTHNGKASSSSTTYSYDRNGYLIEQSLYFDGALNERKTYKHDARGNLLEMIETDDKQRVVEKQTLSYEFDSEGNPTCTILSQWSSKAPDVPLQPAFEFRRIYGSVNTATFALWSACENDEAGVAALLRQGANVNAHHPDGRTALIRAAACGLREIVQALLAAKAKVDDRDVEGFTALMWAAEYGKLDTVDVLLKAGADPNARNEIGAVAIMPATLNHEIEVLKLLLEKGANINASTNKGATALMFAAAKKDSVSVLEFLLENGADIHAKTKDGETALSIAVVQNNTEAAELLRKAGAK